MNHRSSWTIGLCKDLMKQELKPSVGASDPRWSYPKYKTSGQPKNAISCYRYLSHFANLLLSRALETFPLMVAIVVLGWVQLLTDNPGVGDIKVTKVTPDSLTVVWQEPTSAPRCTQGYKLVLSQDRQFKQQINKTTVGTSESRTYTFTGLYQCTLYYISVQAMPNQQIKYTSSFTSVISNATVKDLTTDNVYEDRIKVSWIPFDHWLSCVLEYKVEVISGPFYYNIPTNNTDLEISGLEPCTTYGIHVTVLFWGGGPSQQSAGITARTLPGGKHLNETVQQIQVQHKSDRSLTISWQGPKSGMNCVDGYIVYIQDSKRYRVSSELTNHTVFEFTNLKQCEVYYVHVRPHYYGTTSTASTLHQPKDSFIVTNTTAPDNVVVDLRMKAGWNSLQLDWTLRDLYRNCVSEYVVQVCSTDCLDKVTVHGMTYSVSNLSVCTVYSGSVVVKLSETRSSTKKATFSQLTRSADPYKSQSFHVVKVTTNTVEFQWEVWNMPSACAREFVLSTFSTNGSIIAKKELDYSHRNYTVVDLKPCQSYSFELKLVDENGTSTVDYNAVNVITEASVCIYEAIYSVFAEDEKSTITHSYTLIMTLPAPHTAPYSHGSCAHLPTHHDITGSPHSTLLTWQLRTLPTHHDITGSPHSTVFYSHGSCAHLPTHHDITGSPHDTVNVSSSSSSVEIDNLVPCRTYTITTQVVGIGDKRSKKLSESKSVSPQVLPAPREATILQITKRKAVVKWKIDTSGSDCGFTDFRVSCEPSAGDVSFSSLTSPITVTINGLVPFMQYKCKGVVVNNAGSSNFSEVTFSTSEGVPSQPKNVTVTAISSSEVRVQWDPPDQMCGILNNYTVVLQNRTLRYKVAPGCQLPTLQPLQVVVNGTTTTAVITELPADMQFQATVAAATKNGGSGPSSAPVTSETLTGVSDPVRNMSVTVTQNSTKLWWLPPCNTGGPLSQFLVKLNGSTTLHHNLQHGRDLNEKYSDIYNNSLLKAETSYEVTIIPVGYNETYGQPKSEIFTVPPRIPAEPDEEKFKSLPPVESSSRSAVVTIHRDTFPNTEGTVRYFTILVAESFPHGPSHGWLTNGTQSTLNTWAKARQSRPTPPYQARPPWPNPFQCNYYVH
ncbi:hypothetical protein J6590_085640 [Homalodisca vitripennis]|nr:hypothetical protein J6590_085640 [Homalodisca vitripennis]